MKYLMQLCIIGVISFFGEILNLLLPLPVPASVYGMVLLFLCLCFKIIKLEQVEDVADYLVLIMPLLLVSPGVGIIDTYSQVKDSFLAIALISIGTTVVVMAVTGWVTQFLIRRRTGKKEAAANE